MKPSMGRTPKSSPIIEGHRYIVSVDRMDPSYIGELEKAGAREIRELPIIRAYSLETDDSNIERVRGLTFVKSAEKSRAIVLC